MQFELIGHFYLSKNVTKKQLEPFFTKTVPQILTKGIKNVQDVPELLDWSVKKDVISLKLRSVGKVKAYEALLRIRKQLYTFLGKLKVGLKRTAAHIKIKLPLAHKPVSEIKLPFVKKIKIENDVAILELTELDDLALEKGYPLRIAQRFLDRIVAQIGPHGKAELTKVIFKSRSRLSKYVFQDDPTRLLIDCGWVKEFPGAGIWIIMPPYAALIRAIYNLVIDKLAKPAGFTEIFLPRLIPLEVHRLKGQLSGIPQEIFWVSPPAKRDREFFADYCDYVEITGECAPELLAKKLRPPMFGLSYAQCEAFYDIFRKETLDCDKLPFKFYDVNGPTWRWEGGGLKGLERLNEFQRIEFAFIGTKDQVIEIRDDLLKRSQRLLDELFDIEYRIDATSPVYLEHAGRSEQVAGEVVKSYDLTALLPFQTASRAESEIEIASFHVHEDFYVKRFKMREKKGRQLWTGCAGIGPSRWAFVFVCRWGTDPSKWPKEILKYIKKLPKSPEMITWPKRIC